MKEPKEHYCNKMNYEKGNINIRTVELTNTSWIMFIDNYNITIYDIKYCPYCGVKLD